MRLVLYPDPILLRPAAVITDFGSSLAQKAEEMIPFMELEGGIGLAAPQVGWGVRLLIASKDGKQESAKVLINPEIVWKGGGSEWGEEGCLSFPGIYGEVLRANCVRVKAQDLEGREYFEEGEGLYARVLQHEIDHLNGAIFVTKMRPIDRMQNRARLLELVDRFRTGERTPGRAP